LDLVRRNEKPHRKLKRISRKLRIKLKKQRMKLSAKRLRFEQKLSRKIFLRRLMPALNGAV
jgi:hypothetical protein